MIIKMLNQLLARGYQKRWASKKRKAIKQISNKISWSKRVHSDPWTILKLINIPIMTQRLKQKKVRVELKKTSQSEILMIIGSHNSSSSKKIKKLIGRIKFFLSTKSMPTNLKISLAVKPINLVTQFIYLLFKNKKLGQEQIITV